MNQSLVLVFLDAEGKKRQIRVDDPREDITPMDVVDAMNTIIEKDIFGGAALVSADSAYIITTQTDVIDVTQEP